MFTPSVFNWIIFSSNTIIWEKFERMKCAYRRLRTLFKFCNHKNHTLFCNFFWRRIFQHDVMNCCSEKPSEKRPNTTKKVCGQQLLTGQKQKIVSPVFQHSEKSVIFDTNKTQPCLAYLLMRFFYSHFKIYRTNVSWNNELMNFF